MVVRNLLTLYPATKRVLLVVVDLRLFLCSLSAFALRFSDWWPIFNLKSAFLLFVIVPVASVLVMWRLGLYRTIVRYMDLRVLRSIGYGTLLLVCMAYSVIVIFSIENVPRSVPLIFGMCAWLYIGGSRVVIREIYTRLSHKSGEKERIIIFGAGSAGVQLAHLCKLGSAFSPVAFVDEKKSLWNREVSGLRVHSPQKLPELVKQHGVNTITLAMPSASEQTRRRIIKALSNLSVDVKTMPTLSEIVAGEPINNIREVAIEELLGRSSVEPVQSLLEHCIKGKNVCITGAGGSIGSELGKAGSHYWCQSDFAPTSNRKSRCITSKLN